MTELETRFGKEQSGPRVPLNAWLYVKRSANGNARLSSTYAGDLLKTLVISS